MEKFCVVILDKSKYRDFCNPILDGYKDNYDLAKDRVNYLLDFGVSSEITPVNS